MPSPHEIPADLDVVVVDHPLAASRLSTMRDARTDNATFRAALRELTLMLIYEASRTLATEKLPIHTPVARDLRGAAVEPAAAGAGAAGRAGHGRPGARADPRGPDGLRRAGPGRADAAADARTWSRCPNRWPAGRSTCSTRCWPPAARWCTPSNCLQARGATDVTAICALAAPEGLFTLAAAGLGVRVVTASVDERLNDSGYIVPGLGDAGDRQFGAV